MHFQQILIIERIILHVNAHTMKECLEVVKSLQVAICLNQ